MLIFVFNHLNRFFPNAPLNYALKTLENRKVVSLYFQRLEKGCIDSILVNEQSAIHLIGLI